MKSEIGQGILPKQQLSDGGVKSLKHSVLESEKIPVRIDNRTIIYVFPSEIDGAKERHLKRHQLKTETKTIR